MEKRQNKVHWDYLFWFIAGAVAVWIMIKILKWF